MRKITTTPNGVTVAASTAGLRSQTAEPADQAEKISLGDFEIDRAAYTLRYRGKRVELALNEYFLAMHFLQNPNRVFQRQQLIAMLGKNSVRMDDRTVDVWVGRLRSRFRQAGIPDHLRTVRSVGYVFDESMA